MAMMRRRARAAVVGQRGRKGLSFEMFLEFKKIFKKDLYLL